MDKKQKLEYQKEYRRTHQKEIKEYRKTPKAQAAAKKSRQQYKKNHPQKNIEAKRRYFQKNRERLNQKRRELSHYLRFTAMNLLGGVRCCECGILDSRILEINHIKGNGTKKRKQGEPVGDKLYRAIINGNLDKTEFNVLCRICNVKHYIRSTYGIEC